MTETRIIDVKKKILGKNDQVERTITNLQSFRCPVCRTPIKQITGTLCADKKDPTKIAVFPLAMPLMATSIGIVYLTVLSVNFDEADVTLIIIALMLLLVMLINLGVLLLESRILKYVDPQAFGVAERILGILLAALAVQTILNGLRELGIVAAQAGLWTSNFEVGTEPGHGLE